MKKAILLSGLLLAVSASFAAAQGLNLSLNDCGTFGIINAPASCATSTGIAMSMVGSVVAPSGINRMVACEGYIDGQTSAATLSPWWTLDGCRSTALAFNFDFTAGPFNCTDFWAGQASGGGGISPVHTAPNRFQIKLTCATVAENAIDSSVENYLFKVNITRAKTTGTGNCTGCTDAACLVLNRVILNQPAGVGDATITLPIARNYVTYNNGTGVGGGCPGATPSQNRTWGQVKSLYR